jgi:hypothetical protein
MQWQRQRTVITPNPSQMCYHRGGGSLISGKTVPFPEPTGILVSSGNRTDRGFKATPLTYLPSLTAEFVRTSAMTEIHCPKQRLRRQNDASKPHFIALFSQKAQRGLVIRVVSSAILLKRG